MSEPILTTDRLDQERAGKIRTFTGKYVNPLKMRHIDIDIRDIAHHLSNVCRFAGALPRFWSVAQHSLGVCYRMGDDPEMRLAGLLHDAAEAYLGDMCSPMKHSPEMEFFRAADAELTGMIFERYGLRRSLVQVTKSYDDDQFRFEVDAFWGKGGALPMRLNMEVESDFLEMFWRCTEKMKAVTV